MNADLRRALAPARRGVQGLALAAAVLWAGSGLYSVKPEQRGVVCRFGRVVEESVPPGIHYHWPYPVESVERPAVSEVRSLSVAFGPQAPGRGAAASPMKAETLLTGDENVVLGSLLLQYTVKSPREFLFGSASTETLLQRLAQEISVARFAQSSVDDLLTSGRQALQVALKEDMQRRCDAWGLGVRLTSVQIQRIEPPSEVAQAFKDVGAAREDKQKAVQEAEGDRNRRLPGARADAGRLRDEAAAYAKERAAYARGEAQRFVQTWEAYRKARSATSQRLYLEAIEETLAQVRKIVIDPAAEKNAGRIP
ncbi:MAG TPA: FtsH protease activity modulator HflK [Myxococcales bacterium]